jgi:hypothetical protein
MGKMKFPACLVVVLGLMAGPVYSQEVYIEYDEKYDATGKDTFAWVVTPETSTAESDPLLHSQIVNGIEYYLTLSGAREVETDPDFYVTYHTNTREKVNVDTTHYDYGPSGDWGFYGRRYYRGYSGTFGGADSTKIRSYGLGTLVVDVWDAETKTMVWRGIADNITIAENPDKMRKKIDKALSKMIKAWNKIKKEEGIK